MKLKTLVLSLALSLPASHSWACWFYDPEEEHYHFYNKDFVRNASLLPLLEDQMYWADAASGKPDENLKSWQVYLGEEVPLEELKNLIYGSELTASDLENWDSYKVKDLFPNVYKVWKKNKSKAGMAAYMAFAKSCEPQVSVPAVDEWSGEALRSTEAMESLLAQGKKHYKAEGDAFLRNRYAYQNVRLLHYLGSYQTGLDLANEYLKNWNVKDKDYIYYRIQEHRAGLLASLQSPEASYLFAQLFELLPERRDVAAFSFNVSNNGEWNQVLAFCQNKHEQSMLHVLRALQGQANLLAEIKNIIDLDPSNAYLELLVSKKLLSLQAKAFPRHGMANQYPSLDWNQDSELLTLRQLCREIRQHQTSEFWWEAAVYTEVLLRNPSGAKKMAEQISPQSTHYRKIQNLLFVADLCSLQSLDRETALQVYQNFEKQDTTAELKELMQDVFASLYRRQGDRARAFLAQNQIEELREELDLDLLNQIQKLIESTEKPNALEMRWFGNRQHALDLLHEMRGTYYLQRNALKLACQEYEQLSADFKATDKQFNQPFLRSSIFAAPLRPGTFETDFDEQKELNRRLDLRIEFAALLGNHVLANKYDLASWLLTLDEKAHKAQGDEAARLYLLLGVARLQLSPFEWHRPVLYYTQSNTGGSEWFDVQTKAWLPALYLKYYPSNNHKFYDPDIPLSYLKKGLEMAKNKELGAEICLMAARAEQHRSYLSNENYAYWGPDAPLTETNPKLAEYYLLARKEYGKTEYMKKAIEECGDLQLFYRQNR